MATRNLARTVVEGGQAGNCKALRRFENRVERRLRFDEEGNVIAGRARLPMTKCFADRLAPLRRWLARHVGRGWNNVYREFCESFDRRTLKRWHLDDHLRDMVHSIRPHSQAVTGRVRPEPTTGSPRSGSRATAGSHTARVLA